MRLSLRSRPIHHIPSPAFRHSIKSPSINPRSLFDYRRGQPRCLLSRYRSLTSPPHEYVALTQQGKRGGSVGVAIAISWDCARIGDGLKLGCGKLLDHTLQVFPALDGKGKRVPLLQQRARTFFFDILIFKSCSRSIIIPLRYNGTIRAFGLLDQWIHYYVTHGWSHQI